MNCKHAARSRTLWLNIIAPVLVEMAANMPVLREVLPADYYAWAFFALAVLNAILRTQTSTAVRFHPRREGEHE